MAGSPPICCMNPTPGVARDALTDTTSNSGFDDCCARQNEATAGTSRKHFQILTFIGRLWRLLYNRLPLAVPQFTPSETRQEKSNQSNYRRASIAMSPSYL